MQISAMKATVFIFALHCLHVITSTETQQLGALELAGIDSKTCMTDLGCFEITNDFFHPLYRPINFLPMDRVSIDTEFHLYTKHHPMEYHMLRHDDPETMREVDVNQRTMFIIHGFIDNKYYGKWMEALKDNILIHDSYNVIIVDWSKGNGLPYTKATANTRVVGAEIALLIQSLQKNIGLDPMKVHIVGHSLGAHVAGYAGERVKGINRITGLDPAAPYFQYMPPSVRLDQTDAEFVDIIHTDSANVVLLALGMIQPCGHVDFYPNNGKNQPGCKMAAIHSLLLEGLIDASRRFISCNHQRAVDFFTYSVNYKRALPVGFQCPSWSNYLKGHCSDCSNGKCAPMGMQAEQYRPYKNNSVSQKMYLTTSETLPFWEFVYHITLKLHKPKSRSIDRRGSVTLKIDDTRKVEFEIKDLIPGATYTYLVRQEKALGDIKKMSIMWSSSSFMFFSTEYIHPEHVIIKPMNAPNDVQQKQETKKFCNNLLRPLNSNKALELELC